MGKKLAVKLATLMCTVTSVGEAVTLAAPNNSFLLWGEPTPPMKKEDK